MVVPETENETFSCAKVPIHYQCTEKENPEPKRNGVLQCVHPIEHAGVDIPRCILSSNEMPCLLPISFEFSIKNLSTIPTYPKNDKTYKHGHSNDCSHTVNKSNVGKLDEMVIRKGYEHFLNLREITTRKSRVKGRGNGNKYAVTIDSCCYHHSEKDFNTFSLINCLGVQTTLIILHFLFTHMLEFINFSRKPFVKRVLNPENHCHCHCLSMRHHCDHNSSSKHLCLCKRCRDKIGELFSHLKNSLLYVHFTRREFALLCGYVTCNIDQLNCIQSSARQKLFQHKRNDRSITHQCGRFIAQESNLLPLVLNNDGNSALISVNERQYAHFIHIISLCVCLLVVICKNIIIQVPEKRLHSKPKSSVTIVSLLLLAASNKQIVYNFTTSRKRKNNIVTKDVIIDLLEKIQSHKPKHVKGILYDIINHNGFSRADKLFVYPVSGRGSDVMSNELRRVGSLYSFPENKLQGTPSLIRFAEAGFFYEGKGREVKCFSCGVTHDNWIYSSVPLEIHRQISPECPYLIERFPASCTPAANLLFTETPVNSTDDTRSSNSRHLVEADSVHACTDSSGDAQATLLVSSSSVALPVPVKSSIESGFHPSTFSSNSTLSSRSSQRSSILTSASRDSGLGSSFTSSDNSTSNRCHQDSIQQLPVLTEEQSIGETPLRDSATQFNNRNTTQREKYPEYKPIEKRRASYKNWPQNLTFLHPLDLSECGFFYSNFGDCVRCFHCGIGLRNWESDDNPWVEHARWSRKCPYLLEKKGQGFIDSVLTVLGLQTDAEVEQQIASSVSEPSAQASSGYRTGSSPQYSDVRDPIQHPAAQYVIKEKIFGDNKERQVKKTMNQLLQVHDWDDITNDMLVNAVLEYKDGTEFMETNTSSTNMSATNNQSKSSSASNSVSNESSNTAGRNANESQTSNTEDPEKIQKENEELKDLYTCKICLDEKVGITFVPCGHLVTCKNCSPKIRRCPLCRTFIRGTIKTTI